MSKQKLLNLLGIAQRAGKVVSGDVFEEALKKNEVSLVFLANDASERTQKQVCDKSEHRAIFVYTGFNASDLSRAIGKSHRVVLGIIDRGLSKKMITYIKEEEVTQ